MSDYIVMLKHIAVYIALTLPGFILVKTHIVKTERTGVLSKLLLYVAVPCLIGSSIVKYVPFDPEHIPLIATSALVGLIFSLIVYFVSKPLTRFEKGTKEGMLRFCMCFGSLLSIPLTVAIYGTSTVTMVVTVVCSVKSMMLFPLGIALIRDDKREINVKHFFYNPVFIGIVMGVILNLIHIQNFFPELVIYPTVLGGLVTPISMLVLGMKLAEIDVGHLLKQPRVYYVSLMRIVVFPILLSAILIGLSFIPALNGLITKELIIGTFIVFSAPTAGFSSTFAARFNGDLKSSNDYPITTAYFSLITLPILYAVLTTILNLI